MDEQAVRPDLMEEVRLKVPLPIVIPALALLTIGLLAIAFSWILLSVPKEAATAIAIVVAANILGACAVMALRPRLARATVVELVLVALYPVVIGIAIAQTGVGEAEEAHAPAPESPAPAAAGEIVTEGTAFNIDTLELKAGEPKELPFENKDPTVHNLSIYEGEPGSGEALFKGPDVEPGASTTYKIDPLKKGEYSFVCDYHTNMVGDVVVQ